MYESTNTNQKLAEYVKKNLAKGYTLESLKYSLMNQGYSRISVEKAIEIAKSSQTEQITKSEEKPKITYKLVDENNNPIFTAEHPFKKSLWQKVKDWFS
ncbi:MAG: hypothetical protein WC438_01115 [Candidatus Pacearchaeota archaeon]